MTVRKACRSLIHKAVRNRRLLCDCATIAVGCATAVVISLLVVHWIPFIRWRCGDTVADLVVVYVLLAMGFLILGALPVPEDLDDEEW